MHSVIYEFKGEARLGSVPYTVLPIGRTIKGNAFKILQMIRSNHGFSQDFSQGGRATLKKIVHKF